MQACLLNKCYMSADMAIWFEMETVLEETVSSEDLKRFEQKYHTELQEGKVSFFKHIFNLFSKPNILKDFFHVVS